MLNLSYEAAVRQHKNMRKLGFRLCGRFLYDSGNNVTVLKDLKFAKKGLPILSFIVCREKDDYVLLIRVRSLGLIKYNDSLTVKNKPYEFL